MTYHVTWLHTSPTKSPLRFLVGPKVALIVMKRILLQCVYYSIHTSTKWFMTRVFQLNAVNYSNGSIIFIKVVSHCVGGDVCFPSTQHFTICHLWINKLYFLPANYQTAISKTKFILHYYHSEVVFCFINKKVESRIWVLLC